MLGGRSESVIPKGREGGSVGGRNITKFLSKFPENLLLGPLFFLLGLSQKDIIS